MVRFFTVMFIFCFSFLEAEERLYENNKFDVTIKSKVDIFGGKILFSSRNFVKSNENSFLESFESNIKISSTLAYVFSDNLVLGGKVSLGINSDKSKPKFFFFIEKGNIRTEFLMCKSAVVKMIKNPVTKCLGHFVAGLSEENKNCNNNIFKPLFFENVSDNKDDKYKTITGAFYITACDNFFLFGSSFSFMKNKKCCYDDEQKKKKYKLLSLNNIFTVSNVISVCPKLNFLLSDNIYFNASLGYQNGKVEQYEGKSLNIVNAHSLILGSEINFFFFTLDLLYSTIFFPKKISLSKYLHDQNALCQVCDEKTIAARLKLGLFDLFFATSVRDHFFDYFPNKGNLYQNKVCAQKYVLGLEYYIIKPLIMRLQGDKVIVKGNKNLNTFTLGLGFSFVI